MGKATAIVTAAEFLKILTRSHLVSAEQIAELQQDCAAASDAKAAARQFVKAQLLTPWQAMQLLAGSYALKLGPYTLREQTGKGEHGRVYLAEHSQLNRLATIKILREKQSLDAARQAFGVDHPNLLRVLDVDQIGNRYYVAIEHVAGPSLSERLEEQPVLAVEQVVQWVRQTAAGLEHVHGNGLIHGSIRPDVLLVDQQNNLKIADLGMAELASTTKSTRGNKTAYLSPEQLQNEPLTPASDVYALGATFYCLLAGQPPFEKLAAAELSASKQAGPAKTILDLRADVPTALVKICEKMMAPQVDQRFATAEAVEGILGEWLGQNAPVSAGGTEQTSQPGEAVENAVITEPVITQPTTQEPATRANPSPVHIETQRRVRTAESQPESAVPAGPRKLPLGIIITAACSVVLILVLLLALVIFVFLPSGDPRAVAQAGQGGQEGTAGQAQQSTLSDLESDPEPETAAVDHTRSPAASRPAQPAATASTVTTKSQPSTPTDAPAPTQPAPAQPTPTQPAPAQPEPAQPEPAQPEPAQPEPAKPEPEPEPATEPFRDLAAQVDLPPLDPQQPPPTSPVSLGPVHLGPKQVCFIRLVGGRQAIRGKQQFKMASADDGRAEREWELCLAGSDADKGQVIAKLALADGKLTFQWNAEGASQRGASQLRNCLLSMSAGNQEFLLGLRKPIQIDAPTIDLKKPALSLKWDLPAAPDPAAIKIHFTGLDGNLPEFKWEPAVPLPANKGLAQVRFTGAHAGLEIDLATSLTRQLEVRLRPFVNPPQARRMLFSAKTLQQAQQVAENTHRQATLAIIQADQLKNDELKKQHKNLAKQALQRAAKTLDQVKAFNKVLQEGAAKLEFRVIYRADQREIELLRTAGAKSPAGP